MEPSLLSEEEIKALRFLATRYVSFLDGKLRWFHLNKCMICYTDLTTFLGSRYLGVMRNEDGLAIHAREHLKEHKLIAFI